MAHYALIDSNNIVVSVITGVDETVTQIDRNGEEVGGSSEAWEQFYEKQPWHEGLICKRTSYNNNIRKQFAGIGHRYNADLDIFTSVQPYPSWVLDSNHDWQPPTPMPIDNNMYYWDAATELWTLIGPKTKVSEQNANFTES